MTWPEAIVYASTVFAVPVMVIGIVWLSLHYRNRYMDEEEDE